MFKFFDNMDALFGEFQGENPLGSTLAVTYIQM